MASKPDPNDLEAMEKAVNEAAARASTLWASFIMFWLYLMIAVGSVTHRMLFLETPIKLPVLNVDLPLTGFFVVAPAILVVFHYYLLVNLALLAGRTREYGDVLHASTDSPAKRARLRQRLSSFLVLQAVAGPGAERQGWLGANLRAIAWLTLVAAPVGLLLFVQTTFLPYHNEAITWVHRATVLLDLVLLGLYWRHIAIGAPPIAGIPSFGAILGWPARTVVALFAIGVATFPGEEIYTVVSDIRFVPVDARIAPIGRFGDPPIRRVASMIEILFEGPVNEVEGRPAGWLANVLVLSDQDFISAKMKAEDLEKLDKREDEEGRAPGNFVVLNSFRGRQLRGALLDRADLRRSDFTGADLSRASLASARLDRSRFECADARRTPRASKSLWENPCSKGDGQSARLIGVNLDRASLRRATLDQAQLQGASLQWAHLQGASLDRTQLQGAMLDYTRLQGASIRWAQLRGSSLHWAHLQGVSLSGSQLQGASLDSAQLQGASLERAQLQGASLNEAQMQGAVLVETQAQGMFFKCAMVWRATAGNLASAWVEDLIYLGKFLRRSRSTGSIIVPAGSEENGMGTACRKDDLVPLDTDEGFNQLVAIATDGVQDELTRDRIARSLASLRRDAIPPEREAALEKRWRDAEGESKTLSRYQQLLAAELEKIACDSEDAIHVLRGIVGNDRIKATGPYAMALVAKLRDRKQCSVANEMTKADKAALDRLVK